MSYQKKRLAYGKLQCQQIDGGPNPQVLVVCLHGYGAPGDDLVPLAEQWISLLGPAASQVRFVFPAALLSLDHLGLRGGRAWWELNMARLMQAMDLGDFSELAAHEPPGIEAARTALVDGLAAMQDALGITTEHVVVGGFSQGAMLAMDVALRGMPDPPAVLFQFSGTLICESQWKENLSKLTGTEVIQSHGSFDPILPYESAESLYEMLKVAGVPIQFFPFNGPHTLTYEAIASVAVAIARLTEA